MTKNCNKLLLAVLPVIFFFQAVSAQNYVSLNVSSDTVAVGDTVCLTITVKNFVQILGVQVAVNWDASQLEFVRVEQAGITDMPLIQYGFNPILPNRGIFAWEDIDVFNPGTTVPDSTAALIVCFKALVANTKAMVVCNDVGMPPSSPAAIENDQGINLYNTAANLPGTVCTTNSTSAISILENDAFAVYPNPFNRELLIHGPANTSGDIRITNLNGQAVFTQANCTNGQQLLLPNLPSGVYIMDWNTANGEKIRQKLIRR